MALREIIFRGKRLDNGEWEEGFYCKHDKVKCCFSEDDPETKHLIIKDGFCDWGFEPPLKGVEVDPATVGQFTGLLDKNGKRIFEGAIMAFAAYGFDYVGSVEIVDGNACVMCKHASPFLDQAVSKSGAYIIGNIHDNPELLEVNEND